MYFRIRKDKDMLCGPACIHYILNFMLNMDIPVPNQLLWITDIATFLKTKTNLKVDLSCYDSNLYSDYLLLEESPDFDGFKSIREYLFVGGSIDEKKLSVNRITSTLYDNVVIACVSSSIFNKDNKRNGGHFIVLLENRGKNYVIANPKSNSIEIEIVSKEHVLNSINSFGSWIITINKR